jgi:hypothetical protein
VAEDLTYLEFDGTFEIIEQLLSSSAADV